MALAPGDKATITSSGQIIKVLNQDPNFRSWMTRSMVFEDQSLSEVIQVLNKVYDTQIIFDIPPPDCMVTVSFDNQSLEAVMNVLSGTLDFNFEHRDDAYVITDAACH
jgi:ferric-dicitrate binding protein FerR (iron transport regulator)